jgi:hypothetical protein
MKTNIVEAFKRLNSAEFTDADLMTIYEYCLMVARKHVLFLNSLNGTRSGNTLFSQTIEDEAQTYVARLFTPVRKTGQMLIHELWNRYQDSIMARQVEPAEYVLFMVRRVIANQRNDVMRYQQPQESRIRRAIRHAIQQTGDFAIKRIGQTAFVVPVEVEPGEKTSLSLEDLKQHCYVIYEGYLEVAAMARLSLEILSLPDSEATCFRLDHLYTTILSYLATVYKVECESANTVSDDELKLLLESAILTPARNYIHSIIDNIYVESGKLAWQDGELYKEMLGHYLDDLYSLGRAETFTKYIDDVCSPSKREKYIKLHKNRLYYLVGLLRQRLEELARAFVGSSSEDRKEIDSHQEFMMRA